MFALAPLEYQTLSALTKAKRDLSAQEIADAVTAPVTSIYVIVMRLTNKGLLDSKMLGEYERTAKETAGRRTARLYWPSAYGKRAYKAARELEVVLSLAAAAPLQSVAKQPTRQRRVAKAS